MKKPKIKIQDNDTGALDDVSLLQFDIQTDLYPTRALLHKQSRFLYVVSGYGKIKIQNQVHEMKAGSVIALLPWQISEIVEISQEVTYYLLIYNFNLMNFFIKKDLNLNDEKMDIIQLLYQHNSIPPSSASKKIKSIFDDIRNEIGICSMDMLIETKDFSTIYLTSKLIELLVLYLRQVKSIKKVQVNEHIHKEDIFKYMYLNCTKNLSLETLSKVFLMSESALSKYITQITGLGFYDLLHEMRLSKAQFLLLHTNLTLKDIADMAKFSDPAQLSKIFSERHGIGTKRFKKANKSIDSLVNVRLDHRSTKIIEYIYDHYDEDIDILDISNLFQISPKSINRILVYYMEQNFNNFLNQVRIYKSCSLLLETKYTITDIAAIVGYHSTKTFNRNFIKFLSLTPSEFRKNIKED